MQRMKRESKRRGVLLMGTVLIGSLLFVTPTYADGQSDIDEDKTKMEAVLSSSSSEDRYFGEENLLPAEDGMEKAVEDSNDSTDKAVEDSNDSEASEGSRQSLSSSNAMETSANVPSEAKDDGKEEKPKQTKKEAVLSEVNAGVIAEDADGNLYYYDADGIKQTTAGWVYWNGKKYFASGNGSLYVNRVITFGTYGYYMGADGSVTVGHFQGADGVYRYADEEGNVEDESYGKLAAIGWREKQYFAHGGFGELYHDRFISFGSTIYYMTTDGSIEKRPIDAGKGCIYLPDSETGAIEKTGKAGWLVDLQNNKKRFTKGDGTIYANRIITFGTYGYYMGADGSVMVGHFQDGNGVYRYADQNGNLEDPSYGILAASGWREKQYFAHGGFGELYRNRFITFGTIAYYMGEDGAVIKEPFEFSPGVTITPDSTTGSMPYHTYANLKKDADALRMANSILDKVGRDLKKGFDWSASAITYETMSVDPNLGSAYYAAPGFYQNRGNCFTMAGTFYYFARALHYNVQHIAGTHQGTSGDWPHSWVEILLNGETYVCDPDFTMEWNRNGYMIRYGEKGTLKYNRSTSVVMHP